MLGDTYLIISRLGLGLTTPGWPGSDSMRHRNHVRV
jgi:hypothetical protein